MLPDELVLPDVLVLFDVLVLPDVLVLFDELVLFDVLVPFDVLALPDTLALLDVFALFDEFAESLAAMADEYTASVRATARETTTFMFHLFLLDQQGPRDCGRYDSSAAFFQLDIYRSQPDMNVLTPGLFRSAGSPPEGGRSGLQAGFPDTAL